MALRDLVSKGRFLEGFPLVKKSESGDKLATLVDTLRKTFQKHWKHHTIFSECSVDNAGEQSSENKVFHQPLKPQRDTRRVFESTHSPSHSGLTGEIPWPCVPLVLIAYYAVNPGTGPIRDRNSELLCGKLLGTRLVAYQVPHARNPCTYIVHAMHVDGASYS